jgi:hypothetical protein
MEVHHHTQTRGKKWTHYFWEFLMLFLAVFCGFLAEKFREHELEQQREKQYMKTLLKDLKEDTTNFRQEIKIQTDEGKRIDSLIDLLKSPERNKWTGKIYFLARSIPSSDRGIITTDKTYEQMKSSGNLRLIEDTDLLDSIGRYYSSFYTLNNFGPNQMKFDVRHDLYTYWDKLFDASVFQKILPFTDSSTTDVMIPEGNPPLLTNDPFVINEVCMRFHNMYFTKKGVVRWATRKTEDATRLIKKIEEEYHLK